MANIYTHDDLKGRMKSPGWALITRQKGLSPSGTLEHVLGKTHKRKTDGHAPSLIHEIATGIELDMIQIEKLWQHLGLPLSQFDLFNSEGEYSAMRRTAPTLVRFWSCVEE
jgi:hypothetical protein